MPTGFTRPTTLSDRDRVVVRALAEAMFDRGEDDASENPNENERLDQVIDDVDRFISVASKTTRFGLRVALFFVRLAPILLFMKLTTIERLPKNDRIVLLARLEREKWAALSMAFIGWRTVMTLIYYEDDLELRAIGYRTERARWKRGVALPLLASSGVQTVPAALESGVRVKGDNDEPDSLPITPAAANDNQEVA